MISTFTESIVKDAVLERFGELDCATGHSPHFAPSWPAAAIAELEGMA